MMTPYHTDMSPNTRMRCVICGKESTLDDFNRNGAVAMFVGTDSVRPICVCNSESCMGAVTVLGGQVRRRMKNMVPQFSVSPQNDGRSVSVSVGDMGVIFPAGPFINMYLDIGTSISPKLRPEPGSVKIPSIPYMMSGTIPETPKPTEKEQDGLDHDTCPCCGARDLWTFEDGPQDIVVTCNKCGMSGSGRNRTEAMANLASKKGVSQ